MTPSKRFRGKLDRRAQTKSEAVSPVHCEVEEIETEGDYGTVAGVELTCSRCGHQTESCGTGESSVRRCLALMREECPKEENNFYEAEGS